MGNFYTQVWVSNVEREACKTVAERLGRRLLLGPSTCGHTPIFDSEADSQDLEVLDSLALTLSHELDTWAIGILNHDDSHLVFRLFDSGTELDHIHCTHFSSVGIGSIGKLKKALNPKASMIALLFHFLRPSLNQVVRHESIAKALGLPSWTVGAGFNYLRSGDFEHEISMSEFVKL